MSPVAFPKQTLLVFTSEGSRAREKRCRYSDGKKTEVSAHKCRVVFGGLFLQEYPSSHNHGDLWKIVHQDPIFHFHDYGRKSRFFQYSKSLVYVTFQCCSGASPGDSYIASS